MRNSSQVDPVKPYDSGSFVGDVASDWKKLSTSSVEKGLNARIGGDDGIVISFLTFFFLCFGSLRDDERFLALVGSDALVTSGGVGGPGNGGGGIGAEKGV